MRQLGRGLVIVSQRLCSASFDFRSKLDGPRTTRLPVGGPRLEGSLEPTAVACTSQFEMPMASRPTFDAAKPCPIEGLIHLQRRIVFHADQAAQSNPEASRHVTGA